MYITRNLVDDQSWGDTATENDVVKKQYENLPYPPFGENEINEEEQWYKDNKGTVKVASLKAGNTLEQANHYLHQGSENFR